MDEMEKGTLKTNTISKTELLALQRQYDEENIALALDEIARRGQNTEADWREEALCSAEAIDPELFDVDKKDQAKLERVQKICGKCAVQAECLITALNPANPIMELVWGGQTPEQRKAMLRRARRNR